MILPWAQVAVGAARRFAPDARFGERERVLFGTTPEVHVRASGIDAEPRLGDVEHVVAVTSRDGALAEGVKHRHVFPRPRSTVRP